MVKHGTSGRFGGVAHGGVLCVEHVRRRISSDCTSPDKERAMKKALILLLISALWLGACGQGGQGTDSGQADQGVIRVALGDIESVETLNLFIALEHVRERGVEVEINELADEDIANQAVVGGQSDVGLGAPYGLIEGSSAPLRIFCQLQTLRNFAVVDKAAYPDWQALDGEPFTVHSRGSSTEAQARLVEEVLTVWRKIEEDPSYVMKERERLELLPDLPPEQEEEILPYYKQAAEEGLFTQDCGGREAAQEDLEFYKTAGQIQGDPETLDVEDFWTFDPLQTALQNVDEG